MNREKLKEELERDEGRVLGFYFDSYGHLSFGIGHNVYARRFLPVEVAVAKSYGIESEEFVDVVYKTDIETVLVNLPFWVENSTTEDQQRALANMMFQLGAKKFYEFQETWEHLIAGELKDVEKHLRASLWYKQTPKRAKRIIRQLCGSEANAERSAKDERILR